LDKHILIAATTPFLAWNRKTIKIPAVQSINRRPGDNGTDKKTL
jgi:hypothetical protein